METELRRLADMGHQADTPTQARSPRRRLRLFNLIRPHWKHLTLALVAVLGETVTDVAEPWPIKIIVDNVLQGKAIPGLLGPRS